MQERDLVDEGGQVLNVPVGVDEGGQQTGPRIVGVAVGGRGGAAPPTGPRQGHRRAPREEVLGPSLPIRTEGALVVGASQPEIVVSRVAPESAEGLGCVLNAGREASER